jgi:hypothetical protein
LILMGLVVILTASCGETGNEAASEGRKEAASQKPSPRVAEELPNSPDKISDKKIEFFVDGATHRTLQWDDLKDLRQDSFGTGLEDQQAGYYLRDVIKLAGIPKGRTLTLYGRGDSPKKLSWTDIENRQNKILLGLTHRGTIKVVAANAKIMNRDAWVRHLYKVEVTTR